jgi:hypothetical protein
VDSWLAGALTEGIAGSIEALGGAGTASPGTALVVFATGGMTGAAVGLRPDHHKSAAIAPAIRSSGVAIAKTKIGARRCPAIFAGSSRRCDGTVGDVLGAAPPASEGRTITGTSGGGVGCFGRTGWLVSYAAFSRPSESRVHFAPICRGWSPSSSSMRSSFSFKGSVGEVRGDEDAALPRAPAAPSVLGFAGASLPSGIEYSGCVSLRFDGICNSALRDGGSLSAR